MHILYRIDRTREDQADKTKMINNGVQRDEDGKWMIDPENAVVLQVTTHNRSLIGKDKQKTYPKALMIGKCGGSLQVFQQGLLDGDIVAVMDGGQTFYKYRSMEVENRVSVENVLTKNQDHRLNDEEDAKLEKFFDSFDPHFETIHVEPSSHETANSGSATGGTSAILLGGCEQLLAICDAPRAAAQTPLDSVARERIEKALSWIAAVKAQTYKLKQVSGSNTWISLKERLDARWLELLPMQTALEAIKISGKCHLGNLKQTLKDLGEALLNLQELLKSLSALNC